jgi:hypothetical protein
MVVLKIKYYQIMNKNNFDKRDIIRLSRLLKKYLNIRLTNYKILLY